MDTEVFVVTVNCYDDLCSTVYTDSVFTTESAARARANSIIDSFLIGEQLPYGTTNRNGGGAEAYVERLILNTRHSNGIKRAVYVINDCDRSHEKEMQ